jgi:chorismate mutase/prephenate dehydrogenase
MNLDELRERLTSLDKKIIEIIGERQSIVSEIGQYKQQVGRATRDYERESVVLNLAKDNALKAGIDPKLAKKVLQLLILSSLTNQERARVEAEGKGNGRKVLVIGGAGKMGHWFVDFFNSQGFTTFVADKSLDTQARSFSDWRDAGIDYDVIVIATPIKVSATILHELAEMEPKSLIFDIGSLKTPLRDGLNAMISKNCLITSIHPMFGPGAELLSGKHLIFIDVGNEIATKKAKELFSATMVKQLDMDIDNHDRLIAYVLGLSHALNIAFFTALADSGEAAPKLAKLSSTTFDAQLIVSEAVASDSPELYFEIQKLNEYGLEPLNALCASADKIREVVINNDKKGFIELMQTGKEYLATRG